MTALFLEISTSFCFFYLFEEEKKVERREAQNQAQTLLTHSLIHTNTKSFHMLKISTHNLQANLHI